MVHFVEFGEFYYSTVRMHAADDRLAVTSHLLAAPGRCQVALRRHVKKLTVLPAASCLAEYPRMQRSVISPVHFTKFNYILCMCTGESE